ncbi:MAG: hypothetical protein HC819_06995 [Cyclobacteriaceae bacterium]|nr:hypothetical protein [Cyclobacteriaceae bacterium]
MEDELEVTREKLSGLGKIALGVGGGVVLAAILIGGLKRGHRKKIPSVNRSRVYHRFIDQLVIELSAYATDFAIGVVKSQLYQLADKNITKEEDDSGSIANEKA